MNILVIGALGVNGSWVTRQLLEMGHRPVGYDSRRDFSLIPDFAGSLDVVIEDVLDFPALVRAIKEYRIERICHMVMVEPARAEANPVRGFQVNALSTVQVLEAARLTGVGRVVFTSSMGALSPSTGEYSYPVYKPVSEDYPTRPTNMYGAAKVASELMGQCYQQKYGIDFIALRFASIYGPGKTAARHGQHGFWSMILEKAMAGLPTTIDQGGDEKQDMVYVRDVASSVVTACLGPRPKHQVFHIGNGRGYTLRDFAAAIGKVCPQAVVEVGPGRDPRGFGPGSYYVFDISRAREELGFVPKFDLQAGVKDWVEWMERLKLVPGPFPEVASAGG